MRETNIAQSGFSPSEVKIGIELFDLLSVGRGIRRANVPLPLRMSARSV